MELKGTYVVECYRNGEKIWEERVDNVVTKEGKNHMLKVAISKEENPVAGWYVGLIGANVTPSENDTAQSALGASGTYQEFTAYEGGVRPTFQCAFQGAGVNNTANPATFQFSVNATVYGVFIVSNSTKGSNQGILLSAARFGSPRQFSQGDALVVYYYINS